MEHPHTKPLTQDLPKLLLIALPWLNPFAPGPSPAVMPWLVALSATAGLLLLDSLRVLNNDPAQNRDFAHRWARAFAGALLLAGLMSSSMGLLQYFGLSSALEPWVNQTVAGEAFANLRQRNQFATLTNMALAALVWLAITMHVDTRHGHPVQKPPNADYSHGLVLLAAGLLASGNAASASRTGLMQLVLLGALFALWGTWHQPAVRRILLTAIVSYALASLLLPIAAGFDLSVHGMMARLRAGDAPCSGRMTLWSNVLHLIAQKPWLGWGWGELDYAHYITVYDGPRFCEILDNAHNLPLQLAVELGVPVALLICGGFIWWAVRQQPWRERDAGRQLAWAVLAVILLHSMLEYPLWYGPFQMAAVICAGLLWHSKNHKECSEYASNRRGAHIFRLFIAIILIATCIFSTWDYRRISQIYLTPETRDEAYRSDTLNKIRASWLFDKQVSFAELVLSPLTPGNAQWTYDNASSLLHYSPEPRVVEKLVESAILLGRDDEAQMHLARFQAAFPADHARWVKANVKAP